MRKLFSLSLAAALVSMAFPVRAELLKNVKVDGSLEFRSFGISNEIDRDGVADDYRSEMKNRLMVGATMDLLDDVHGRVLVSKNNRAYGNGAESANGVQDTLIVQNAWAKIDKVMSKVDVTLGRQFFGDPEDLVLYFGPRNDDLLSVDAIDAVRTDLAIGDLGPLGGLRVTGLFGKTAEPANLATGANTNVNDDTDVFGAEVGFDAAPVGSIAAYYYGRQDKGPAATANDTLQVTGARLAGDLVAGLGYRAEYIQNFGRDDAAAGTPAYNGNAYLLALRYGRSFDGRPFRARAEYGRGSRDFTAISAEKRFGIIWGQHLAAPGLSNLKVADVGLGINPIEKLGIDVNAYKFWNADPVAANGSDSLGNEYDVIVSWKHSENVLLSVSAAQFRQGGALDNAAGTPTNSIKRIGGDVKIKF